MTEQTFYLIIAISVWALLCYVSVRAVVRHLPDRPTPLMWAMLDRLGFDVPELVEGTFKCKIEAMAERCRACRNVEECQHWLARGETVEGYRAFCPNALAFDELPRKASETAEPPRHALAA